ncbi:CLUMA_CG020551, isoform A [Clunio marinus]|uniref:CLUMA_CG020551, isoform A n=1 Tax=Clunio marinus TaxID=568069 RepID=A0A1J1J6I8_9DIPT|nr:CLUMA_CG020551, isoform A [Clunio marinus]
MSQLVMNLVLSTINSNEPQNIIRNFRMVTLVYILFHPLSSVYLGALNIRQRPVLMKFILNPFCLSSSLKKASFISLEVPWLVLNELGVEKSKHNSLASHS